MPIYAYKCAACGHEKDVLQKISDDPLKDCPVCGAPAFSKQLTAAGFQLKGSGWYVTDFRNGGKQADRKGDGKADGAASDGKAQPASDGKSGLAKPATAAAATPSTPSAPSPQA